jgi:hypothetical protein
MQKWEYLVLYYDYISPSEGSRKENRAWFKELGWYWREDRSTEGAQTRLNNLGEEGYELVCIIGTGSNTYEYYFKRPKP